MVICIQQKPTTEKLGIRFFMVNGKPRTHNLFTLSIPCRKIIYTVSGLNNINTRQNLTVYTISAPPYILTHEPSLAKVIGVFTSDTNTESKK